ncbi:MAG: DNA-protecting protein DprA [Candidatus Omnitrophica bacterium]|nr:DNA-protecting protein DprA [Candidatus Omnitrophota bacterium]
MRSFVSFKLSETDALLVLNAINGFGIKRIRQLIQRFGSAAEALHAPIDEFINYPGIPQASRDLIPRFDVQDFLKKDHGACSKFGARVVSILDEDYPASLLNISDPPAVIYVSGKFPDNLDCGVAIVGARRASLYGLQVAERFAIELAELGVPIISGLARGVDGAAHQGALRAGGATIAVLGCGLDVIYPPEHATLYRQIKAKGCLISEFPFGTLPLPYNFPRRNRIVSGLSLGVVVVEANIKSGALVTAGFALEQGREVFAVPGRIDSDMSDGPHALIKQGAKPVLSVQDILEELPVQVVRPVQVDAVKPRQPFVQGLSNDQRLVFSFIKEGHTTHESLEAITGFGPSVLMTALLALELLGKIVQKPGKMYALK